ncbi:uncharacterized protein LOC116666976 isoform X4 [Camelus ferus]|uniref:Uncharacterized protein LOC116666976 isoform X4 n=1 Tax=Camelus ferus TaxID=419612 RepID=A0A8B8TWL9_CAMFR|nr:uncharacterized protein LOC116666976 isoform X4 [Camelus ferus]
MLWAGVPFPPEMYRGPPSPGRAVQASARTPAPRVRTFTSRRPPGRALGGGGRLPGLQAGEKDLQNDSSRSLPNENDHHRKEVNITFINRHCIEEIDTSSSRFGRNYMEVCFPRI